MYIGFVNCKFDKKGDNCMTFSFYHKWKKSIIFIQSLKHKKMYILLCSLDFEPLPWKGTKMYINDVEIKIPVLFPYLKLGSRKRISEIFLPSENRQENYKRREQY